MKKRQQPDRQRYDITRAENIFKAVSASVNQVLDLVQRGGLVGLSAREQAKLVKPILSQTPFIAMRAFTIAYRVVKTEKPAFDTRTQPIFPEEGPRA